MDITLVGFGSGGDRRDFHVRGPRFVIGRKEECDLCIPLSAVSRQHAEIVVEGGSARVRDLGSSNGTFLNDVRVQEAALSAGDRLSIGPVDMVVQIDGEPTNIMPNGMPDRGAAVDSGDTGAPATTPPAPAPAAASDDDNDDPLSSLIKSGSGDDSSVFDFDFDLDEDEDDDMR